MTSTTMIRAFKRNWRHRPVASPAEKVRFTYVNRLHDVDTDQIIDLPEAIYGILDKLPEGEIIEITIKTTGQQAVLAKEPWVLLAPHVYGPNNQTQE